MRRNPVYIAVLIICLAVIALCVASLESCSATFQLSSQSVTTEHRSVDSYFYDREHAEPFRSSFYDSSEVFVALDTPRTEYFGASLRSFRNDDSLGIHKSAFYEAKRVVLGRMLNEISLTAK